MLPIWAVPVKDQRNYLCLVQLILGVFPLEVDVIYGIS